MANVAMSYGEYSFSPVPLLNLSREFQKAGDNSLNGVVYNVDLQGTLVSLPTGGLVNITNLQNTIRSGIKDEGRLFLLTCDGSVIISGYPRINSPLSFETSSNNWVFTCPYTIGFQFDELLNYTTDSTGNFPYYISDSSETWNLEFVEDNSFYDFTLETGVKDVNPYQLRLSHSVNAVGKAHYDENGLTEQAWERARKYVVSRLGYNNTFVASSGVFNFNVTDFSPFNHVRTNAVDVKGGSFSVDESWLVINTGAAGYNGNATESFTVDIQNSLDSAGVTSLNIQGTIQGLELRNYGTNPGDFSITTSKYANASGYWGAVQQKLYARVKLIGEGSADRAINPITLSKSIGHNPSQGTITYNYQYDDRPSNCITNSLRESFVVNDTNPNDIFASTIVLGRSAGPILQSIGTSGASSREISIDITMPPVTGCPTSSAAVTTLINSSPKAEVATIVNAFKDELISNNTQVFVNNDTESWDWRSGRYTRNVSWTYSNACVG